MAKYNYANYTHAQLVEEIKKLNKRKKYGLVWEEEKTKEVFEEEGKLPVLEEVKKREIFTSDSNPTNILIEGDNYHALSVLNYTHSKSIDVIYIDPPYNTGNDDFKYNDKFIDREDSYRHSKWLSFMSKRLKLAKNLLKETGIIFISIDDNEVAQLKLLIDDIFGENNFISINIRATNSAKNTSSFTSITHDYTLVYGKHLPTLRKLKINWKVPKTNLKEFNSHINRLKKSGLSYEQISNELKVLTKYPRFYEFDHYYYVDDNFNSLGPYASDKPGPSKGGKGYTNYSLIHPITKKLCKIPSTGWAMPEKKASEMLVKGRWHFGPDENTIPRPKAYLLEKSESKFTGIQFFDSQGDVKFLNKLGINFDFPKPVEYIGLLIGLCNNKNAKILDFFAGSGTTAQAVLELNKKDEGHRQFILCNDNQNNICTEVCYPRVKKIIKGYKDIKGETVEGLGGNLKYYKTNFVGSEPTHRNKKLLTEKSMEMLCIRENTFEEVSIKSDIAIFKNVKKYTAILFNEMKMEEFKREIQKLRLPVSVFVFSLEGDDFSDDFLDLKNEIKLCSIPEAILKVYRRIYEIAKPKK